MVIKKYYLIINKPLYMSEIKTIPIPISNPIRYSKSWHSFSNPNGGLQKYFFDLTINPNSENKKTFRKLESGKHAELIQLDDEIKYSDIKEFKLVVTKMPFDITFNYELEGKLSQEQSSYNQRENEIYVEFSQNSAGLTFCRSSFIGVDFSKMCVSPPN
jgi:hypothetical protein